MRACTPWGPTAPTAAAVGMRADRVRGGPVQDGHRVPQVDGAVGGRQAAATGGAEEEYGL